MRTAKIKIWDYIPAVPISIKFIPMEMTLLKKIKKKNKLKEKKYENSF